MPKLITIPALAVMLASAVGCGGQSGRRSAPVAAITAPTPGSPLVTSATPGPGLGRGPEPQGVASQPPTPAGLQAGRAPTPPSTRPTGSSSATPPDNDNPLGPALQGTGRVNLGGDDHPIVAQEPFGTIDIPKIGLHHPIYEGVELTSLHWGPGHWPGTALPGQFGNTVFAGHRVTHTRPFLDIDRLVPGDQIIFTTPDGRFIYEVTGHQIVTADDVHIADPTLTPTVTLLACHPKGSAQQRYVIRGRLIG